MPRFALLTFLITLGCNAAAPLDGWCADRAYDSYPVVAPGNPCPEHIDDVDAWKAGECGRFDVFFVDGTDRPLQVRRDGTIVGMNSYEVDYGRPDCRPMDCATREYLMVANLVHPIPECEPDEP